MTTQNAGSRQAYLHGFVGCKIELAPFRCAELRASVRAAPPCTDALQLETAILVH